MRARRGPRCAAVKHRRAAWLSSGVRLGARRLGAGGRDAESGVSLLELVIAMFVFMLILGVVYQTVVIFQTTSATTNARVRSLDQAQLAVDSMSRQLRTAVDPSAGVSAIVSAAPNAITFYANLGSAQTTASVGPTKVTLSLVSTPNGSVLQETQTAASGTAPGWTWPGPAVTQVLATHLVTPPGSALFTYDTVDATGAVVPLAPGAPLNTVSTIGLSVSAQVAPGQPLTTVQTQVNLLNVLYTPASTPTT